MATEAQPAICKGCGGEFTPVRVIKTKRTLYCGFACRYDYQRRRSNQQRAIFASMASWERAERQGRPDLAALILFNVRRDLRRINETDEARAAYKRNPSV